MKKGWTNPWVAGNKAVFEGVPHAVPAGDVDVSGGGVWKIWEKAGTRIDAPILGNGYMTAALAGPPEYPQVWISSNDFWQMESAANWEFFHDNSTAKSAPAVCLGGPRPVGRMVFDVPALKGAEVHTEQDLQSAVSHITYTLTDGSRVAAAAFVAADENLLVLKVRPDHDLSLSYDFYFPDETGCGCEEGVDFSGSGKKAEIAGEMYIGLVGGKPVQMRKIEDHIVSGYREFSQNVDMPVRAGFAGCFLTGERSLPAGTGERSLPAGTGERSLPAGTGERSLPAGTEERSLPVGTAPRQNNTAGRAEETAGGANTIYDRMNTAFGQAMNTAGSVTYTSGSRRTDVILSGGKEAIFVLPLRTWGQVSRPYEYALSRAAWITADDVEDVYRRHLSWWKDFWDVSGISLDDKELEERYYLSLYMLASLSGDPACPPAVLGMSTFDRPAWNGNYKINYNHQTPYLCLLVSGHFDQAAPHDQPYLDMLDLTREMSRRLLGHGGAYYPLGLGPKGMVSEALLLHMKSPAVHGAMNMLLRIRLTEDQAYARKVYPFLRSVADFWEADLVYRDGCYHVVDDGMHERTEENVRQNGAAEDPVNTLGYLKTFFTEMPMVSECLDLDEDKREKWKNIAAHLAPYPKGTIRRIADNPTLWQEADADIQTLVPEELKDLPVYYDEGVGGKWSFHFPGNVMHIYPAGAIGLSSDPEDLQTARNTILIHDVIENALAAVLKKKAEEAGRPEEDDHFYKGGAWNADNLSCLFFPAAARAGYDPDRIWDELSLRIEKRGLPNGFFKRNPHGSENLNTVPDTIQEMMLQSHEGILRIFPVWPRKKHPNAAFHGFWACGAFRVSAELKDGEVKKVEILSIKGGDLRLENPWKGGRAIMTRSGREEEVKGSEIHLTAEPGEILTFTVL
ncbi:MAG: hypothetical protein U0L49_08855 [Eubacterium sp.]|nr:hypothetical protein [Eubacterium sp.]